MSRSSLGLADARDHVQALLEAVVHAARDELVRLAEPLPALRVPDDRAVHAELLQHRRRDLARERTLGLPVAVLCEHADLGARQHLHRPASETNGGATTTSTPSGRSAREARGRTRPLRRGL